MFFCVFEFVIPTTSALSGEANTTESFLFSAIVIKLSMWVALAGPAMIKPTSTVSASWNNSAAVFFWASVAALPFAPPDKASDVGVLTAVYVVPDAALPQLVPAVLWSIQ